MKVCADEFHKIMLNSALVQAVIKTKIKVKTSQCQEMQLNRLLIAFSSFNFTRIVYLDTHESNHSHSLTRKPTPPLRDACDDCQTKA